MFYASTATSKHVKKNLTVRAVSDYEQRNYMLPSRAARWEKNYLAYMTVNVLEMKRVKKYAYHLAIYTLSQKILSTFSFFE